MRDLPGDVPWHEVVRAYNARRRAAATQLRDVYGYPMPSPTAIGPREARAAFRSGMMKLRLLLELAGVDASTVRAWLAARDAIAPQPSQVQTAIVAQESRVIED